MASRSVTSANLENQGKASTREGSKAVVKDSEIWDSREKVFCRGNPLHLLVTVFEVVWVENWALKVTYKYIILHATF